MKHLLARRSRPIFLGFLLGYIGGGMLVASAAPAQAAPKSEKTTVSNNVRRFYAWYGASKDPARDRAKIEKFTSRRLSRWLRSPQFADYGADYFFQAQDFDKDWTRATINSVTVAGKTARVRATLGAPKAKDAGIGPRSLKLKMVKENGVWKIDEVSAPEN